LIEAAKVMHNGCRYPRLLINFTRKLKIN